MSATPRLTKRQKRLLDQQGIDTKTPDTTSTFKTHFRMSPLSPLTANQALTMEAYEKGDNLFLHGMAGTGKTYLALALALQDIMAGDRPQKKIVIARSNVAVRDMGHLPGDQHEKMAVYEAPYQAICTELFGRGDAYGLLKQKGVIEFIPTSFIRGITIRDAVLILDEVNNCTFHEIDSVVTRPGRNCRVLICGDMRQSDLTKEQERQGLNDFVKIVNMMKSFSHIEFEEDDIVRGGFVKEYIIAKEKYLRSKK